MRWAPGGHARIKRCSRRRLPMRAPPLTALPASARISSLSFLAASVDAESAVARMVLPDASWERAKSGWPASPDRKQPPHGGQQPATSGGLAAGVAPDLGGIQIGRA